MIKPPIDLPLKVMTSRVSPGAKERLKSLSEKYGARMSDVLSACLLYMPEDELVKILAQQAAILNKLPKAVRGMLGSVDKLSDADRAMLRDALS